MNSAVGPIFNFFFSDEQCTNSNEQCMNNALSPKNYCAWIKKKNKKKGKTQMLNVGVNIDPNKYLV